MRRLNCRQLSRDPPCHNYFGVACCSCLMSIKRALQVYLGRKRNLQRVGMKNVDVMYPSARILCQIFQLAATWTTCLNCKILTLFILILTLKWMGKSEDKMYRFTCGKWNKATGGGIIDELNSFDIRSATMFWKWIELILYTCKII